MRLMSTPALRVWFPRVVEKVSATCQRCSSGKAGRGRALGSPYATIPDIETLGPGAFALVTSRSRANWKRRALTEREVRTLSQLATKMRSWKSARPLVLTELLLAVAEVV